MESEGIHQVPSLLRFAFRRVLEARIQDEVGNGLVVWLDRITVYEGTATATVMVSGTVLIDLEPVDTVQVAIPIIVTVDPDDGTIEAWQVDHPAAVVEIRLKDV